MNFNDKLNTIFRHNLNFYYLISYNQIKISEFLKNIRFIERKRKANLIDDWIKDTVKEVKKLREGLFKLTDREIILKLVLM